MAIIFMDSFDLGTDWTGKWYSSSIGYGSGTYARYGAGGAQIAGDGVAAMKRLGLSTSTVVIGVALKFTSFGTVSPQYIFNVLTDSVVAAGLRHTTDGRLVAMRDTTTLGTSTNALVSGTWNYVEVKATIHPSAGTFVLRVNGVEWLNLSGVNTGPGAITRFSLGNLGQASNSGLYADDLYICDGVAPHNDFLGDTRVQYLAPVGAGVRTQFTPSTGSNWQTVDEAPVSDADYNSNNAPGAMDLFTMADLAGNGLVRGVQTISRARKDDAGFRKAAPVFYKASGMGGTARWYKGSQVPVLDGFSYLSPQVFNTSPDTGVAWTVDEINALQYGYAVGDAGMFTLDAKVV